MSMVKHFAVYNQETNRNTPQDDALVSQRTMHEIYLPQFETAVTQGGAAAVMCAYSTINGEYACQNKDTLNVLDRQWHFPGFVASDWGATHSTVPSALAGLDMNMPGGAGFGTDYYGAPLKAAVRDGQVPMSVLDAMVSRILTEMFRFNLFADPPTGSLTGVVTTPGHAQVGRQVAESGTVLLKNDDGVLPLQPAQDKSVAVIGSDAGQFALTSGGGSASVIAPYVVTSEQGIRQRGAASGVSVSYAQGDVPVTGALATVPASAFGKGLSAAYYNNASLTGKPGPGARAHRRPVARRGRQGALLRGRAGRLPLVRDQAPHAAVPVRYGLSYTTFAFSHLVVRPGWHGHLTVSANVTNTG